MRDMLHRAPGGAVGRDDRPRRGRSRAAVARPAGADRRAGPRAVRPVEGGDGRAHRGAGAGEAGTRRSRGARRATRGGSASRRSSTPARRPRSTGCSGRPAAGPLPGVRAGEAGCAQVPAVNRRTLSRPVEREAGGPTATSISGVPAERMPGADPDRAGAASSPETPSAAGSGIAVPLAGDARAAAPSAYRLGAARALGPVAGHPRRLDLARRKRRGGARSRAERMTRRGDVRRHRRRAASRSDAARRSGVSGEGSGAPAGSR